MHNVDYKSYNVLEDGELREAIKEFSNWPTIPQVYIDGNFVGGCDILLQMHRSGELIEILKKVGIQSSLAETDKVS
jgi:glutaredoxin-related protein 5, mitochondrial